jgi:hypothetical protein
MMGCISEIYRLGALGEDTGRFATPEKLPFSKRDDRYSMWVYRMWVYRRFALSVADVEDLLAELG